MMNQIRRVLLSLIFSVTGDVNGVRWIGIDTILVRRYGHFDREVPGGNQFAICYEVSTAGGVKRLFETRLESSSCQAQ
jgi:hypothetical protein